MARPKNPRLVQIESAFTYHTPGTKEVSAQLDKVRASFKALAVKMHKALPECREASLALTKLEEASMHAISAIVRNQEVVEAAAKPKPVKAKAEKSAGAKRTPKAVKGEDNVVPMKRVRRRATEASA